MTPWARAERFIFLWCIIFGGIVILHLSLIYYLEWRLGQPVPSFIAFGNFEIYILCFLIAPAVSTAATLYKEPLQTAHVVGTLLILAVPVPVIVYCIVVVFRLAVRPAAAVRQLYYG